MRCIKVERFEVRTYFECPAYGQSSDMELCCGSEVKYPGQYCCNNLPLDSPGEIAGLVIGLLGFLLLAVCVKICCCTSSVEEVSTELGVADVQPASTAPPPDQQLPPLVYSVLPTTEDNTDLPPPYPGFEEADKKQSIS